MKAILFALLLTVGTYGCTNNEAEENKRKAQLYDAAQVVKADENGKQKKLETCFADAEKNNSGIMRAMLGQAGCDKYPQNQLPQNLINECSGIFTLKEKQQKESEDRCMRLYK